MSTHEKYLEPVRFKLGKCNFWARQAVMHDTRHSVKGARMVNPGDWVVETPFGELVCDDAHFRKVTEDAKWKSKPPPPTDAGISPGSPG